MPVLSAPSIDAVPLGHHKRGEYVRGLELRDDGRWLRLDAASARSPHSHSRASLVSREQWVELVAGAFDRIVRSNVRSNVRGNVRSKVRCNVRSKVRSKVLHTHTYTFQLLAGAETRAPLVRVDVADVRSTAVEGELREEAEAEAAEPLARRSRGGLAGELLDRPFVPRLDGATELAAGPATGDDDDGAVFYDALHEPEVEGRDEDDCGPGEAAAIAAAAAASARAGGAFPIGACVVVSGMAWDGEELQSYDGAVGVVASALSDAGGRQDVRLGRPHEGKVLTLVMAY